MEFKDRYFFNCTCGGAGIILEPIDVDWDESKHLREIALSMWEYRAGGKNYSLRHKLQAIWDILTRGYPYADDIILSPDDAVKLGNKLIELAYPVTSQSVA